MTTVKLKCDHELVKAMGYGRCPVCKKKLKKRSKKDDEKILHVLKTARLGTGKQIKLDRPKPDLIKLISRTISTSAPPPLKCSCPCQRRYRG